MKITLNQLRRIIREEVSRVAGVLGESPVAGSGGYVQDYEGPPRMATSYESYVKFGKGGTPPGDEVEFRVVHQNYDEGEGFNEVGTFPTKQKAVNALKSMLSTHTTNDQFQVFAVTPEGEVTRVHPPAERYLGQTMVRSVPGAKPAPQKPRKPFDPKSKDDWEAASRYW